MALNGPRSGLLRRRPLLLERIQRLIQPQQQKIELMEKLTATAILLAILTVLGINTPGSPLMASIRAMNLNAFEPRNSPSETQSTVLDTSNAQAQPEG